MTSSVARSGKSPQNFVTEVRRCASWCSFQMKLSRSADIPIIPTFRIMDTSGTIVAESAFPKEVCVLAAGLTIGDK